MDNRRADFEATGAVSGCSSSRELVACARSSAKEAAFAFSRIFSSTRLNIIYGWTDLVLGMRSGDSNIFIETIARGPIDFI